MADLALFHVALAGVEGNNDLVIKVKNDDDPDPEVLKVDCPPGTVITAITLVRVTEDKS